MTFTIDEIKALLDGGGVKQDDGSVIEVATLLSEDTGQHVECQLHLGWDIVKARACDKVWGVFNVQLMRFIEQQEYDEEQLKSVLDAIQVDDGHWSWFNKSRAYRSEEYVWFFLTAEQYPQGACLIYHPKPSAENSGNIFYIEYIAVAPWNRKNPMCSRTFKGVGTMLIRSAVHYAINVLKLRPGFSLHALPKAVNYYKAVGMKSFGALDKPGLPYFEMSEQNVSKFLGST